MKTKQIVFTAPYVAEFLDVVYSEYYEFDKINNSLELNEEIKKQIIEGAKRQEETLKQEELKNTDEAWTENMTIVQAMERLNNKERDIIIRRFFDGRTQMEVADEIGISQAQVSRLEKTALEHMKRLYK